MNGSRLELCKVQGINRFLGWVQPARRNPQLRNQLGDTSIQGAMLSFYATQPLTNRHISHALNSTVGTILNVPYVCLVIRHRESGQQGCL